MDRSDWRIRAWRCTGERYVQCCVIEGGRWGGTSVMVSGGISGGHETPLVCIDGTFTAQRYIHNIMQPVILPVPEAA